MAPQDFALWAIGDGCPHCAGDLDIWASGVRRAVHLHVDRVLKPAWFTELESARKAGQQWAFLPDVDERGFSWDLEALPLETILAGVGQLVGRGSSRAVFAGCGERVLKVDLERLPFQNRAEVMLWNSATPAFRSHLCPVLDHSERPQRPWLLMPRCGSVTRRIQHFDLDALTTGTNGLVRDVVPENIGTLGGRRVLLDYGFLDESRVRRITAGAALAKATAMPRSQRAAIRGLRAG